MRNDLVIDYQVCDVVCYLRAPTKKFWIDWSIKGKSSKIIVNPDPRQQLKEHTVRHRKLCELGYLTSDMLTWLLSPWGNQSLGRIVWGGVRILPKYSLCIEHWFSKYTKWQFFIISQAYADIVCLWSERKTAPERSKEHQDILLNGSGGLLFNDRGTRRFLLFEYGLQADVTILKTRRPAQTALVRFAT